MAFPFFGKEFTFRQPDGSELRVRGWGDQAHAVFETLDGYALVRDEATGAFEYARPDGPGERFVSTGVRPATGEASKLGLQPKVLAEQAGPEAPLLAVTSLPDPHWKTRREQVKNLKQALRTASIGAAPPQRQSVGTYIGLCLLVQFPDVPGTISREDVEAFCNQPGYTGHGNHGSVRDYFLDNSIGRLDYTTIVAPYYTARHPRAHYTDPAVPYGQRARELILEALAHHVAQGFDFQRLSVDPTRYVYATNVFYAGPSVNNWAKGLWPHASRLVQPYRIAPDVHAYDYQITDMDEALTLGTYCHENGHMLCDFPDLYDYGEPGFQSGGVGPYCLMCAGGNASDRNPTQICAYLKYEAGWAGSVSPLTPGEHKAVAGANQFFIHAKSATEYFIIENRRKEGRDGALPGSGLAIWHVDAFGNNSHEQMTPASHYECALEQADGRFDLEHGDHWGDAHDLFHATTAATFSEQSTPSSRWWDGTSSGLTIKDISAPGDEMTFIVV